MVGQLVSRTSGQLVERAWPVIEDIYRYHTELFKLSHKPYASLAVTAIKAWKKREETLQLSTGTIPEAPWYISRLRELLGPGYDISDSTSEMTTSPSIQSVNVLRNTTNDAMPWDQMLGFVDSSTISWDVFGNAGQPVVNNYGAYGAGMGPYQTMNGWM